MVTTLVVVFSGLGNTLIGVFFLKYPARIFAKRPGDDHPEYIKDDELKDL